MNQKEEKILEQVAELIGRMEDTNYPDRDFDAQIHCFVTGRVTHPKLPKGYTMTDGGDPVVNSGRARANFIHGGRGPSPSYTELLDAKLPWENIESVACHEVVEGEPLGTVWEAWHRPKNGKRIMGSGPTEVLARRMAALQAVYWNPKEMETGE